MPSACRAARQVPRVALVVAMASINTPLSRGSVTVSSMRCASRMACGSIAGQNVLLTMRVSRLASVSATAINPVLMRIGS